MARRDVAVVRTQKVRTRADAPTVADAHGDERASPPPPPPRGMEEQVAGSRRWALEGVRPRRQTSERHTFIQEDSSQRK